jgi:acetoin utilization deacetylase AcuC-like enzyme
MLIVSCADDQADSGVMGNQPERRKRMVRSALQGAGFQAIDVSVPEADLSLASCVHSPGLLGFLDSAWERWEQLWTSQAGNRGYLEPFGVAAGVTSSTTTRTSNAPEVPALVPCYVAPRDGLQRPSATVIGALAVYALDRETPITRHTRSQLCFDLAVVRECVERVVASAVTGEEKKNNNNNNNNAPPALLYAQVTHPGHHSGADFYGGFCFLNNVAIAARQINRRVGKRVAILDVDYHAANGTMSAFFFFFFFFFFFLFVSFSNSCYARYVL